MIKDQADGNAYGIAEVYAYRGQPDKAMHWLERSYTQKEPFLFFVKTEIAPTVAADDPRLKAFLKHKFAGMTGKPQDAMIESFMENAGVPVWWPQFCLTYDLTAAAYLRCVLTCGRIRAAAQV